MENRPELMSDLYIAGHWQLRLFQRSVYLLTFLPMQQTSAMLKTFEGQVRLAPVTKIELII